MYSNNFVTCSDNFPHLAHLVQRFALTFLFLIHSTIITEAIKAFWILGWLCVYVFVCLQETKKKGACMSLCAHCYLNP